MDDNVIKPIELMTNDELISFLTVKKDNIVDDYRDKILVELNNRGIKLEDILNVAEFKINSQDFEKIDVSSAFEKTSLLKKPLDVIYYKNYMGEYLAIQKHSDTFVLHHHNPKSGFSSYFLHNEEMLKDSLNEFLSLGNWLPEEIEIITHWETFAESTSADYILRLADMLDSIKIDYSINSNRLARFNSFTSPYSIVLPMEKMEEADEVLIMRDNLINNLLEKLELVEKEKNVDKQLEILTELESLTPEDASLFYNKAKLLDKKGDYQNASDAFIESFNLDFGNGSAFDVQGMETYLLETLDKVENKTNILHCLATISAYKGDIENAFKYYNELIDLDENDSIAHLNLGYLFYSHSEDDEKVKLHLTKYMELEPESPEIDSIQETLNNLQ